MKELVKKNSILSYGKKSIWARARTHTHTHTHTHYGYGYYYCCFYYQRLNMTSAAAKAYG